MNKFIMILIITVLFAVSAGLFFAFTGEEGATNSGATQNNTSSTENDTKKTNSQSTDRIIELEATGGGKFITYTEDSLRSSKTKYNVLFFHAEWCPTCRSVKANLETEPIPDDVTIFEVDYDSDLGKQLLTRYSIPDQYTSIQVDSSGNEITRWIDQYNAGVSDIVNNLKDV